jgi:hypothetical protein
MIMMDAEADESTLPLVPYQPAIVKQYRPMSVRCSAFSVQRRNHIEGESVPMSLFNR